MCGKAKRKGGKGKKIVRQKMPACAVHAFVRKRWVEKNIEKGATWQYYVGRVKKKRFYVTLGNARGKPHVFFLLQVLCMFCDLLETAKASLSVFSVCVCVVLFFFFEETRERELKGTCLRNRSQVLSFFFLQSARGVRGRSGL